VHVLRGLLFGMIGFASFFLVEALVIRHDVAVAFVAAALTAVVAQGASLWWLRRPRVLAAV
jgi:site-specific recombinase